MAKRRKVKTVRLLIVLIPLLVLVIGGAFFLRSIIDSQDKQIEFKVEDLNINEIDHSEAKTFDFDLASKSYLLMRLNDFKVLYQKNNDTELYPASLTKVLTMDTILDITSSINETATFSNRQREELIEDNASIAYLEPNEDYTIEELLYALILPSGADAAVSLENYAFF